MTKAEKNKKQVKKVSKMPNAMATFKCIPDECKLNNGEPLKLEFFWATHMSEEQTAWVFNLFERNMRQMYNMSQDGYDPHQKKHELFATTSRYILVKDMFDQYSAYCHYRVDMDNGSPVIYCYELQVESAYQKKGIGGIIIELLEKLSGRSGMEKVVATVFAFNPNSLAFFHKHGYTADVTCPDADANIDYLILSKATPAEEQST